MSSNPKLSGRKCSRITARSAIAITRQLVGPVSGRSPVRVLTGGGHRFRAYLSSSGSLNLQWSILSSTTGRRAGSPKMVSLNPGWDRFPRDPHDPSACFPPGEEPLDLLLLAPKPLLPVFREPLDPAKKPLRRKIGLVDHFNCARPHNGIGQTIPEGIRPQPGWPRQERLTTVPLLNALHHDYRRDV